MSYTTYGREWYECTRCRHRLAAKDWQGVRAKGNTPCPFCRLTYLKDFVARKLPPLDELPRRR